MVVQTYLAVMAGGAVGVAARLFLSNWASIKFGDAFPWGTILVNILGCFVIGVFSGLTGPNGPMAVSPVVRHAVMIGILGGFTTFSSFSLQTMALLAEGEIWSAGANVALSVTACLLATWAGLSLVELFNSPG